MNWISVKDSVPRDEDIVVITGMSVSTRKPERFYSTAIMLNGYFYDNNDTDELLADPDHWMPLVRLPPTPDGKP